MVESSSSPGTPPDGRTIRVDGTLSAVGVEVIGDWEDGDGGWSPSQRQNTYAFNGSWGNYVALSGGSKPKLTGVDLTDVERIRFWHHDAGNGVNIRLKIDGSQEQEFSSANEWREASYDVSNLEGEHTIGFASNSDSTVGVVDYVRLDYGKTIESADAGGVA